MSFPQRFGLSSTPSDYQQPTPDEAVQSTNDDAALSRLSAHTLSYFPDSYTPLFIRGRPHPSTYRRPPIINIGTHARTLAIDALVEQFLLGPAKEAGGGQIVSLGAGSDTRFWRIRDDPRLAPHLSHYTELDFPLLTTAKARSIVSSQKLSSHLTTPSPSSTPSSSSTSTPPTLTRHPNGGTGLSCSFYSLIPHDIREGSGRALPVGTMPDKTKPTLWLAECVLCYLQPEVADGVVKWFEEECEGWVGGVVYEMFGLSDSFGKVLLKNLSDRSISIPSAHLYPSLSALSDRFSDNAYTLTSSALTINQIRSSPRVMTQAEGHRVERLEGLDEVEEMELLFGHYAVSWGCRGPRKEQRGEVGAGQGGWGL